MERAARGFFPADAARHLYNLHALRRLCMPPSAPLFRTPGAFATLGLRDSMRSSSLSSCCSWSATLSQGGGRGRLSPWVSRFWLVGQPVLINAFDTLLLVSQQAVSRLIAYSWGLREGVVNKAITADGDQHGFRVGDQSG